MDVAGEQIAVDMVDELFLGMVGEGKDRLAKEDFMNMAKSFKEVKDRVLGRIQHYWTGLKPASSLLGEDQSDDDNGEVEFDIELST